MEVNEVVREAARRLHAEQTEGAGWRAAISAAYEDRFWNKLDKSIERPAGSSWAWGDYDVKYQRNDLRGWVLGHLAALMYARVTPSVATVAHQQIDPAAGEAIKTILDQWLNGSKDAVGGIASQWKQTIAWNLLFGHTAFKFTVDGPQTPVPMDRVVLSVAPRWELDWDPRCSDPRRLPAFMHAYPMRVDKACKKWPEFHEKIEELAKSGSVRDPLDRDTSDEAKRLQGFVMVGEFIDLTDQYEPPAIDIPEDAAEGEVEGEEEEDSDPTQGPGPDEPQPLPGVVRFFLLQGSEIVAELGRVRMPFVDPYQRPLSPLIPAIMTHGASEPCRGIPAAATVYNLEATVAFVRTWQVNAARRDMARKLGVRLEQLKGGDESRAKLRSGRDGEFIELNSATEGSPVQPLTERIELPPVPESVKILNDMVEADRALTASSLADQVSSDQTKYITATQAQMVGAYAENEVGEMRSEMDKITCELMRVFLAATADVMRVEGLSSFPLLLPSGALVDVPVAWFEYPWQIGVGDTPNTPMAEGNAQQAFMTALPMLKQAAMDLDYGMPGVHQAALAIATLDHVQRVYRLPDAFGYKALSQVAAMIQPPAPPAPEPMAEPAPGEPDEADLAAQEIADAESSQAAYLDAAAANGQPLPE